MMGQSIQGYLVIEKIKEGSVGPVWRVQNSKHEVFAVKQMSARNAADPDQVRRFEKEVALTRKLAPPAILRVYERLDCDPPAFRMQYFDSENLKYSLWNAPERVVGHEFRILRQVGEALAYLHARGIVHRDVKPENVLVNVRQEARLIDFSLAQSKMDRLLQFGKRVDGTPLYMAPEQIRGEKCDPRADVYSFGVMTYELLTRRPPFLGTTQDAILDKHLKEAPPPLRAWVPTLSPDLEALVLKALAKKREERWPDLATLLYELGKWEKKDTDVRVRQLGPLQPPTKK
ncbi:MAG: serine/threonine protein kinase [Planctomycetaceae bacterium]|nr:serine/threonine protein kinase [Planctomycetaceae bacterium]